MRKFKGFTLSELMIALAVVGILVAVVTPAIMKNRPNKNKMMIKKSYYLTEKIVSNMVNDEMLYPDKTEYCYDDAAANTTCYWGFDDTSKVNFEGEEYGGTGDDAKKKFYNLFKTNLNVKQVDDTNYTFKTADGISWNLKDTIDHTWASGKNKVGTFDDQTNAAGICTITIDVNGNADPNCRQSDEGCSADDFDQYNIQILANGKLRIDPDDTKAVEYVTINTSIKDNL